MAHIYTEDQLVEQPAIQLFAELGWQVAAPHPHPGPLPAGQDVCGNRGPLRAGEGVWVDETGLFGRETKAEVVLEPRLRTALERLNPSLPAETISLAIDTLTRNRSALSLAGASREIYDLLKNGIKVSVPDRERGGQKTERVRVVDWQNPAANDFLLVSQFSVTGTLYTCRPDPVGFVSGSAACDNLRMFGVAGRTPLELEKSLSMFTE